jgi:DNA-binding transcriptional LysR family regulator
MLTEHLEKLVHFSGVVRAGSIRSYATANRLSQPAISKCIRNLESDLEITLLVRDREGVALTQAGQELFTWSEAMLSSAKDLHEKIRERADLKLKGELKMGTYQSIAVYFVPRFFKFIQKEQEHLQLHFVSAPSADLITMLKAGKVDFVVSIDPPKSAELFQIKLFEDTYSLYQHATKSLKLKDSVIFTLPAAKDREGRSLESYLISSQLWSNTISCGDFEAAKALLEANAGFALLPERVALPLLEERKIEKVKGVPSLSRIGTHSVVFSCKAHRAADASMLWIANQLRLMLGTND